jgi:hypothetical protein
MCSRNASNNVTVLENIFFSYRVDGDNQPAVEARRVEFRTEVQHVYMSIYMIIQYCLHINETDVTRMQKFGDFGLSNKFILDMFYRPEFFT